MHPSLMLARLTRAVAAVAPVAGLSLTAESPPAVAVQYDGTETPAQVAAAEAVVAAFDWSEQAQRQYDLGAARQAAITGLLTRPDDTAVGVRLAIFAVCDLFNLRLEAIGQPKVLMAEILTYIASNPTLGDPQ